MSGTGASRDLFAPHRRVPALKIHIPTPLRSYTKGKALLEADGVTLQDLLTDVDGRYPGFRFRILDEQDGIRQHIKIFVNQELASTLSTPLDQGSVIHIICALSGG